MRYADAGVDIGAGARFVDAIKPHVASTRRLGAGGEVGGFGGLFDLAATGYRDPILVAANDGVGTKVRLAVEANRHETIGIDLVAMCVNDLVVQGAEPLFFLDYLATGKLAAQRDETIVAGIAEGCRQANCALIGGETAEMPGIYTNGDYDLAGFAVGAVERDRLLPRDVCEGDVLLGLASSGLHSNGFSLVRAILDRTGLELNEPSPFGEGSVADTLLEPTRIYVLPLLNVLKDGGSIHALAHITGGGLLENVPRVVPGELAVSVDLDALDPPPVFEWLREEGLVDSSEMLRTFNCGVGMVLIVDAEEAGEMARRLRDLGETVMELGRVIQRNDDAVEFTGVLRW